MSTCQSSKYPRCDTPPPPLWKILAQPLLVMNFSSGSRGGVGGPGPPLFCRPNWSLKGWKKIFGDCPAPHLISKSGSGTEFPAMHAEYHGNKRHICFKTPTYSKCHSCLHFSRIEINYKVKKKKIINPLLNKGVKGEEGLFNLAKMMVSVLQKNCSQSGKAQSHEVGGHTNKDQEQIRTSNTWIHHNQISPHEVLQFSLSFENNEGGEWGLNNILGEIVREGGLMEDYGTEV